MTDEVIGTAIVLFTDLVGSTTMRSRIGEDAADRLSREHERLMRQTVADHAGTVVKGGGDGVMATFVAATDAIAAAVDAQQRVHAQNDGRQDDDRLSIRVGVSVGDVTWANDDCYGRPVVEASRLVGIAAGGQILCSTTVRVLTGGRGGFAYRDVGPLELEGFDEPLESLEVTWEPTTPASVQRRVPESLRAVAPVVVGRRDELARLGELHEAVGVDGRRMALLEGPAGIGKTALMAAAAERFAARGSVILYGRCDEQLRLPFEPIASALRWWVREHGKDAPLGQHPAELLRIHPDLSSIVGGLGLPTSATAETERYRLFAAVRSWLDRLAEHVAVVVAVDDLQWADPDTVSLIRHLLGEDGCDHLLMMAAVRDTDPDLGGPVDLALNDFSRRRILTRVPVGELSRGEVVELASALGLDDPSTTDAVFERAGGNPLFVRALVAEGGGGDPVDHLPVDVVQLIRHRVAELSESARAIVEAAAIIGHEFTLEATAATTRLGTAPAARALHELQRAALVSEVGIGRYQFSHGVVRDAISAAWTLTETAERHLDVAGHLRQMAVAASEVATHLLNAGPLADPAELLEVARAAADDAGAALAWADAVHWTEVALEAENRAPHHDPVTRCELLLALGQAASRAGEASRSRDALLEAAGIARALNDPERLARVAVALVGPLGPGEDTELSGLVDEAVGGLRSTASSPGQWSLLSELLAEGSGYSTSVAPAKAATMAEEALSAARKSGDDRVLAVALVYASQSHTLLRQEHQARLQEISRLAERIDDVDVRLLTHTNLMSGALLWADRDEYDRHLARYAEVAERTRVPRHVLLSAVDHVGASALDGRYADALEEAREARRHWRSIGDKSIALDVAAALFPVRREQGTLRIEPISRTVDILPGNPSPRAALNLALVENGETEEAAALLGELLAAPPPPSWFGRRFFHGALAEVAHLLDDERAASVLLNRMADEPRYGDCVILGPNAFYGATRRFLGLLSTTMRCHEDAVEHHAAALEIHERMRARGWVTRSRYDLARALLGRSAPGDAGRAAQLIDTATTRAVELGMNRLLVELRTVRAGSDE